MPDLGETLLMSPQAYSRMECGGIIIVTIDVMILIFNDGSTLLVQNDSNTNLTLLASCRNDYVT